MLWVHYLEANKLWSIVEFSYLADIKITQNVNNKIIVSGLLIRMYQKPINNDLVVIVLRNFNVSWTAKFNNWPQLFFSIWIFFREHSRITGQQGKGQGISATPHYYFHPLYKHLDINRAITAESSPLHIASSRTRTGNLWFPSASR